MREANPRAHVTRLITERNYLGAYLYLKETELEREEFVELVGLLAGAVVDELSRTRREDRERIYFLRSILAWILRDVPGLGSLYREQLRESRGGSDWLGSVSRGFRNARDMASGSKSMSEGFQDAADEAKKNLEDAAEAVKSGEAGARLSEFLGSTEAGIRQGLDQLSAFFRTLNEQSAAGDEAGARGEEKTESDARRAARASAQRDVEDAEFEESDDGGDAGGAGGGAGGPAQDIHVERDPGPKNGGAGNAGSGNAP